VTFRWCRKSRAAPRPTESGWASAHIIERIQSIPRGPRSSVVEREIPVFVVSSRPSVQSGSGSYFYLYGLLPRSSSGVGYSHFPTFIFLRATICLRAKITQLHVVHERLSIHSARCVLIHPASLSRHSADLTRPFKQNWNSLAPNSRATSKACTIFA
jgi:hypothetical protein